jgi:hypothetical protein
MAVGFGETGLKIVSKNMEKGKFIYYKVVM